MLVEERRREWEINTKVRERKKVCKNRRDKERI
jgi:hypothetical protein